MFISLFFLTLIVVSVSSQDESEETYVSCFKILDEGPARPNIVLDSEQMISLCPTVKRFLDCQINEQIRFMLDNVGDGEDRYLERLRSQRSLANDLCDQDSELHKAYAASVDCFRSLVDKIPICLFIGKELYNDYREFIPPLQVNNTFEADEYQAANMEGYIKYYQPSCVEESYQIACIAIEILETCGSEAYDVFSEFIRRSGEMKLLCWNEKNHKLRSTFLEFLEKEKKHKQIDIISQMFNLRKK